MSPDQFPFVAVTIPALFTYIVAAAFAGLLQPVCKGDTFLDQWWGPTSFVRLFTVKRAEVKMPLTWGCIVTARLTFTIFVVSLILDLCIN